MRSPWGNRENGHNMAPARPGLKIMTGKAMTLLLKYKEASIKKRQPNFPVRRLLSESFSLRGMHIFSIFILVSCRMV